MKNILNKIIKNKNIIVAVSGIAIVVTGGVMMKKASLKCNDIIKEHQTTRAIIEECVQMADDYTEEAMANDMKINDAQTAVKIVMNYAIPVSTCILGGCMIINGIFKIKFGRDLNEEIC